MLPFVAYMFPASCCVVASALILFLPKTAARVFVCRGMRPAPDQNRRLCNNTVTVQVIPRNKMRFLPSFSRRGQFCVSKIGGGYSGIHINPIVISFPFLSLGLWQKALRKYCWRALRKKFHILNLNYILLYRSPTHLWLFSNARTNFF